MNKIVLSVAAAVVIAGGGGFYGGMQYGQTKSAPSSVRSAQNSFRGGAGGAGARGAGGQAGGGFVGGEVLSKDDKSLTIKLRDGSTKIVFFSGSTSIGKMTAGAASDLVIGEQVTVSGTANSDGTITAENIQLRPASVMGTQSPKMPVQN